MIKGIGIDICQISRIKLNLVDKILSDEEKMDYEKIKLDQTKKVFLAGRFAVKEAIYKALSDIYPQLGMTEVVVLNDENGKPYLKKPIIQNHRIVISISHEKEYAVAQAILEEQ